MRIALYNLHFATLGGGERRTALLAAHLARTHEVALFSETPLEIEGLRRLFGIDLSAVQNIVLPANYPGNTTGRTATPRYAFGDVGPRAAERADFYQSTICRARSRSWVVSISRQPPSMSIESKRSPAAIKWFIRSLK